METKKRLKLNQPHIVHETIDGETILLDLRTGIYYSMDGSGCAIWNYLEKTGDREAIINILSEANTGQANSIKKTVSDFFDKLTDDEVLVENSDMDQEADPDTESLKQQLIQVATSFIPPVINKYADMQDLLQLDPIHDVDEAGWPEPKEED